MIEEAQKYAADQKRKERITTLVSAMLTGHTAPGEALIAQVVLVASAIVGKIEAA
jgi:hypothetical protein